MLFVRDYLLGNERAWADRVAYTSKSTHRTWREVAARSRRLATALRRLGVGPGDVVGTMGSDGHEVVELWFAASMIGAVRTGVNPRYSASGMEHVIRDSEVKVLVVEGGKCETDLEGMTERPTSLQAVIGFGEHHQALDYDTLLAEADELLEADWAPIADDDVAMISYTSGSTAGPKGVVATHAAITLVQTNTWFQAGMGSHEVFLHTLPASGTNILMATWNVFNGSTVVLVDRFETRTAIDAVANEGVTTAFFVPTMLQDVLDVLEQEQRQLPDLRRVIYGAAPSTPALIRRVATVLGCELQQWYGSTEATAGWTTLLSGEDHVRGLDDKPHILQSVGRPTLHTELRIVDDDGNELPRGEVGAIAARSATTMLHYRNLPEQTAAVLRRGDWLEVGDVGYQDEDGYVYVLSRKDFMIISGGYNVFPTIVENCLAEHPRIDEAVVFGLPDERWGEVVSAALVVNGEIDEEQVRDFCRATLASYEIPRQIFVVEAFPWGSTGKTSRTDVRAMFLPA